MKTLLLVEDEIDILHNNRRVFEEEGYRVLTAENLKQARQHLAQETPEAIVLDIMLPDGNGLDLLKELREAGSRTPIIMLTAWGKSSDVSRGLKLGANDYLSKPFKYDELLARVETMFRNVEQVPEAIEKGALCLDVVASKALINGVDMLLTQKEFAVLLLLAQNEDRTVSTEYIYEKVWKQLLNDDTRTLKKHISSVRSKLEEGGSVYTIAAYRGAGYRFETV